MNDSVFQYLRIPLIKLASDWLVKNAYKYGFVDEFITILYL